MPQVRRFTFSVEDISLYQEQGMTQAVLGGGCARPEVRNLYGRTHEWTEWHRINSPRDWIKIPQAKDSSVDRSYTTSSHLLHLWYPESLVSPRVSNVKNWRRIPTYTIFDPIATFPEGVVLQVQNLEAGMQVLDETG